MNIGGIKVKTETIVLMFTSFLMIVTAFTGAYAVEKGEQLVDVIKGNADLTGDDIEETIVVKGLPVEEGKNEYSQIFVEVKEESGEIHVIEIDEGKKPQIEFVDLDHDGIKDLFISVQSRNDETMNTFLYSFKGSKIIDILIPDPLVIQSEFLNDYKASVLIENNYRSYRFNLKNRKDDYEKAGIYQNGQLNEPMELIIKQYSKLEPYLYKKNKYGLKGTQIIAGIHDKDILGVVESRWVYKNGQWKLVNTMVKEKSAS